MPDADYNVEAIVAGTEHLLSRHQERAHILRTVLKAIDQFDDVRALTGSSDSAEAARTGLMELLNFDPVQARAVAGMQVLRLAKQEHQQLADDYLEAMAQITDLESTLASPDRQRALVGTARGEYLANQAGRPTA